ncbi:hypothetical protein ES703_74132 [subsurface metagenome]
MVEIEIMGHKAKIERVSGQEKLKPWHPQEMLVVWIAFDEAVAGTMSFAVSLPAKKYERDEFLYNVRRRGEEQFKLILEKHEREERAMEERQERKKALDAMVAEAQSLIE